MIILYKDYVICISQGNILYCKTSKLFRLIFYNIELRLYCDNNDVLRVEIVLLMFVLVVHTYKLLHI